MTEQIKTFNSIIESFLAQTSGLVGTTYYNYFQKLVKVNALIAIDNAVTHMLPHKDKIFNKDESYFIAKTNHIDEYGSELKKHNLSHESTLTEIFRLKDIYYELDDVSKENIWSILQALVQLTIEYCEIKGIKMPN